MRHYFLSIFPNITCETTRIEFYRYGCSKFALHFALATKTHVIPIVEKLQTGEYY